VNVGDALHGLWQSFLDFITMFILPDWGAIIGLIPLLLLLFVLGPILSLIALVYVIYFLRKPRVPLIPEPAPVQAAIGEDGRPVFPRGEVFCYRDGLIYPPSARRCEVCGDELSVRCPKCEVVRQASIDTCGNCGLVLKLRPQAGLVPTIQPPPGGAAAA
jgi:hypothetical protein